jgi:hypothetical protein
MSGTFSSTNEAYLIPYQREQVWHPYPVMLQSDPDSDSSNDEVDDEVNQEDTGEVGEAAPVAGALPATDSPPPDGPTLEERALRAQRCRRRLTQRTLFDFTLVF